MMENTELKRENGSAKEDLVIDTEDRLLTENYHLKLQVLGLRQQDLTRQLQDTEEHIRLVQTQMLENRVRLEAKYKIDLNTMQITSEGKLIPKHR